MRLLMFPQWDKLSALLRTMARQSAADYCQRNLVRLEPKGGRVQLADRSMNNLAVSGGATAIAMPDIEPGKARDFMLRVEATGENALSFEGAEAFEGEADALQPPGDGETCVYFFTETAADVLLVARKVVTRIETEGEG